MRRILEIGGIPLALLAGFGHMLADNGDDFIAFEDTVRPNARIYFVLQFEVNDNLEIADIDIRFASRIRLTVP